MSQIADIRIYLKFKFDGGVLHGILFVKTGNPTYTVQFMPSKTYYDFVEEKT